MTTEKMLKQFDFPIPNKMVDEEFEFLKNQSEKEKNDTDIKKLAKKVKPVLLIQYLIRTMLKVEDSDLTQAVVNEISKCPGQEKQVVNLPQTIEFDE